MNMCIMKGKKKLSKIGHNNVQTLNVRTDNQPSVPKGIF